MSFLAGRLASIEGAYFLQESRLAVDRLIQKNKKNHPSPPSPSSSSPPLNSSSSLVEESQADVLPEILRHSLPSKIFKPLSDSTLERPSVWVLPQDPNQRVSVSIDVINPLRSYLALPQVTFGPKRWQLPEGDHSVLASTANELRTDRYTTATPENLKAAAAGLSQILQANGKMRMLPTKEKILIHQRLHVTDKREDSTSKIVSYVNVSNTSKIVIIEGIPFVFGGAFAVATAVVFGGAALTFGLAVSKLELQNGDDIRNKARDLFHPKFEGIEEQLVPLRVWAQNTSKKWRTEREEIVKENRLVKELSKRMGVKTPN